MSDKEQTFTIRQPATANLMLDSADRTTSIYPSWGNFQIFRNQALLNGFFTRIATTEVVLEWNTPNVSTQIANKTISVDISGGATISATIASGFYNFAQALQAAAQALTDLSGTTGYYFTATNPSPGLAALNCFAVAGNAPTPFSVNNTLLARQLALYPPTTVGPPAAIVPVGYGPDLRPTRFLDFVSQNITYCQNVKDNSTQDDNKDVLCRWYFDFDNPPSYDSFGYPILMGYSPFCLRRIFNPPKQIKWDSIQPIGNLAFEVYDSNSALITYTDPTQWLMTLQISEN